MITTFHLNKLTNFSQHMVRSSPSCLIVRTTRAPVADCHKQPFMEEDDGLFFPVVAVDHMRARRSALGAVAAMT